MGVCIVRAASRERIIGRWAFCGTSRLAPASHEIWNGPKLIYGSDNEFYLGYNHFNNSLWNRVLWCYYTECLRWGWNESLPALAAVRPFKGALREIPPFRRSFQSSAASGAGEWDWKMMFSRSYNGSHTHTIPRLSIVQSNLIRSRALLLVNFFCSFKFFFCLAGHRVGILFQRKNASQFTIEPSVFLFVGQSYIM